MVEEWVSQFEDSLEPEASSLDSVRPIQLTTERDLDKGPTTEIFTLKNTATLAKQLGEFISDNPFDRLANSSLLQCITQGLDCAVGTMNGPASILIGQLMYQLARKDPKALVTLLGKPIGFGEFAGQNTAYVWIRELYLATLGQRNDSAIIAIHTVLAYLMAQESHDLATHFLVRNTAEGSEKGKNSFYVMAQIVNELAHSHDLMPTTSMMATLLESSSAQSPEAFAQDAIKELNGGLLLKGKHTLYMLASVLKEVAKDNPPVAKIICSMINRIVTTQQSKDSESAFFKIAAFGEFKGLSTTHLIVTSLVSASYISKNQQVIADITNTLTQLHQVAPEQFARSLIDPITRDKRATTNGISLLVQSLIAALDHGNKIEAMVDLLFFLTKHDPNAMSTVCKKDIVLDSEGQESISPLARLETVVHRITDEQNKTLIEHLIRTWSGLHQMNRNRFFMTSEATYDESLSRVELKPNSSR